MERKEEEEGGWRLQRGNGRGKKGREWDEERKEGESERGRWRSSGGGGGVGRERQGKALGDKGGNRGKDSRLSEMYPHVFREHLRAVQRPIW